MLRNLAGLHGKNVNEKQEDGGKHEWTIGTTLVTEKKRKNVTVNRRMRQMP